eukprot:GHUV01004549.1.p1 GENE.GHUV01004549.1~~GHUV01004549.1.p1  ORF type:complete len:127 (+),score=5.77 GHUV01004549.1:185-565(+)
MVHQDQYYAEETFSGLQNTGRIYTGPLLGVGVATILASFGMSSITKRSPNLAFRWLQRRVGAQFMTIAYFFTCNLLYWHDGRQWRTRDVSELAKRAYGPLVLQYERRKRAAAKKATEDITGGVHQE